MPDSSDRYKKTVAGMVRQCLVVTGSSVLVGLSLAVERLRLVLLGVSLLLGDLPGAFMARKETLMNPAHT